VKKKILFYCGSVNQTSQLYQVSQFLSDDYDCWFTPAYAENWERHVINMGWVDVAIVGRPRVRQCLDMLESRNCQIDYKLKRSKEFDLVYLCTDIYQPKSYRRYKRIVVQEGFIIPEDWRGPIIKRMNWTYGWGDTQLTALTDEYDYFCTAGEGYKQFFINRGANPGKLVPTGVPNFDNLETHLDNDFPQKDFALIITSAIREGVGTENRMKYLRYALDKADGREVIFKLHPHEKHGRASREIRRLTKEGTILTSGNTEHMIANSACVIARASTVIMTALALDKPVYSPEYRQEELRLFRPKQNGGDSARVIADLGRKILEE
jgi:hypothetical protein